ncbi:MAG: isoprenyl transferase [Deltaproteobacteria bacterium]|nr:isoprenyl transferase [Deltaproteobacteria bacterium]
MSAVKRKKPAVSGEIRIPRHVAIIMDGNGRWAQARGLPRVLGHREGVKAVRAAVQSCAQLGVRYLTLYAFSTENWNRPRPEVSALMHMLDEYLLIEERELIEQGIRLNAIGEIEMLPRGVRDHLQSVMAATAQCKGMVLTLAVSYGSRAELVRGIQVIARKVQSGVIQPDEIDDRMVAAQLYTADMPDPDLLIRTSGEMRISNFLLWQLAYAEIYFSKIFWPDFRKRHLLEAFRSYSSRERRFGKTAEQLKDGSRR